MIAHEDVVLGIPVVESSSRTDEITTGDEHGPGRDSYEFHLHPELFLRLLLFSHEDELVGAAKNPERSFLFRRHHAELGGVL